MVKDKLVISREEVKLEKDATTEKLDSGANLDLFYEIEVRDKNGNLISKRKGRSKSLLRNFALMLRGLMAGNIYGVISGTTLNVKVTVTARDGTTLNYPSFRYDPPSDHPELNAPSAMEVSAMERNDKYGILVGTGTAPVTKDDYDLNSQIPDGFADGQMVHGKTTVEDVNGDPPSSVFRIIRTFTNEGSSTITVYEIGLVARVNENSTVKYVLIARDVLDTPQDVPAGATLTVRYIFKVTA